MNSAELRIRTEDFSVRIISLVRALKSDLASTTIARQIIRSGTSVTANYRAVCLAKSRKDFINKLRICAEEADETALWIQLIIRSELLPESKVSALKTEAEELTAIFLPSIKTARDNS